MKDDKNKIDLSIKKKKLVLFDFDGTLTKKDTFLSFLLFAKGNGFFYSHFVYILVMVFAMKLGIISTQKAKEKIYALFFKNISSKELEKLGKNYAFKIINSSDHFLKKGAISLIKSYCDNGDVVSIVSASPEIYVKPFCDYFKIGSIATKFEYDANNKFTGRFEGKNCNGDEKVNRIKENYKDIDLYEIEAFGDSDNDLPMLSLATDYKRARLNFLSKNTFIFKCKEIIRLLRVQQYIKNIFIFIPLFFSGQLFIFDSIKLTCLAFISFSFCSSFIYVLNDICDIDEDRNHLIKRFRPIAAETISIKVSIFIGMLFLMVGLYVAYSLTHICAILILIYLFLNLLYVFIIKKIALLDLVCIAIGFDIRLFVGAFALNFQISSWLVLMVFLLSMFLATGKRWDDLSRNITNSKRSVRVSLYGYNREFALSTLTFLSAVNTICYIQYTMDFGAIERIGSNFLFLTSIWVILGNLRYLQVIFVSGKGYSPTKVLLGDRIVLSCVLLWGFHILYLLYGNILF